MGLATATCDTMTPQVGVFSRHSVANCVPCDTRCIGYQVYKICTTGRLYNSCKKQVRVGRKLGRIRGISANTYCNGRETGSVNGYNLEGINNEMRMVGLEGTFGATGSGSRDSFSHNGNTGDALANRGGLDELLQSQDAGPVLPGINAAALCQTIKLTQEKNLELQKQLNETVGLLAAAAKALETYQATTVRDD